MVLSRMSNRRRGGEKAKKTEGKGKPMKMVFLLFGREPCEQEGGAVSRPGLPTFLMDTERIPVFSTLALRRLEFLSPWGGAILCFHYSIFVVT